MAEDPEKAGAQETFFIVPTTVDGETVTGVIKADRTDTQVIHAAADSSVAGASAAFLPGSIALDTSVSIGSGSNFVTDGTVTDLALGTGVEFAADAVAI